MKFIKRLFIKNYENTSDDAVRKHYGTTAGLIGITVNVLLFLCKITVGVIGKSMAIIADALNNLSDSATSAVMFIGFKLSARPADREHPYGHARYEYITGLTVSFIMLAVGAYLAKSSIEKIIEPAAIAVSIFTYLTLALSLALKTFLFFLYGNFHKSINSGALKAGKQDSLNDILITAALIAVTILYDAAGINLDGIFGLIISLLIFISGIKLVRESINPLIGTKPDAALIGKIEEIILSHGEILGVHDIIVHNYGVNKHYAAADVEVSADTDIRSCHTVIDGIEREVRQKLDIDLTIHTDPVDDRKASVSVKERLCASLKEIDAGISVHDFRLERERGKTKMIFDISVPFDCATPDGEITARLSAVFGNDFIILVEIDKY